MTLEYFGDALEIYMPGMSCFLGISDEWLRPGMAGGCFWDVLDTCLDDILGILYYHVLF